MFEDKATIGYDHGYDARRMFYLGLAFDPGYVEGFVEGCLQMICEDQPEDGAALRDLWEDGAEKYALLDILEGECEVRPGRPLHFYSIAHKG